MTRVAAYCDDNPNEGLLAGAVDRVRGKTSEAALVAHDFSPEVVKGTGPWQQDGDTWRRGVYVEVPGEDWPSHRLVFVVVFKEGTEEVERSFAE